MYVHLFLDCVVNMLPSGAVLTTRVNYVKVSKVGGALTPATLSTPLLLLSYIPGVLLCAGMQQSMYPQQQQYL